MQLSVKGAIAPSASPVNITYVMLTVLVKARDFERSPNLLTVHM
jgi:hypothetical protein